MKSTFKITCALLAIDATLVVLHLLFSQRLELFHLDHERTIPAYFSGAQLVAIAALSLGLHLLAKTRGEKILLGINAFFFLMLGFDEISELHENITYYLVVYIKPWLAFRTLTYMWLVFFGPAIVGAFAFFAIFLKRILRVHTASRAWYLSGIACFAGAIFLELASGLIRAKWFYPIEIPLEEGLEIVGATLILTALMKEGLSRFHELYLRR